MAGRIALALLMIVAGTGAVWAQMTLPAAKPPSGEDLFKRQCATCHSVNITGAARGTNALRCGRPQAGRRRQGFPYSAGFAKADWTWDEAHPDTWLTNPQAMIAGAIMPYRQGTPEVRAAIIGYFKELH